MRTKLLLFAIAFLAALSAAALPLEEGKAIFSSRCAGCHNINKVLTGPALEGVHERRSIEWIINFVRSSQTLVKNGDKDAVALFEKFNKIPMPDHPDLTDDNIKSIVEYIKSESSNGAEKAPFAKPSKLRPNYIPLSINDTGFILGYLTVIAMLVVSLLFAVHVKSVQRKIQNKKD
jgi:mono/diheme cytochrome c family protein